MERSGKNKGRGCSTGEMQVTRRTTGSRLRGKHHKPFSESKLTLLKDRIPQTAVGHLGVPGSNPLWSRLGPNLGLVKNNLEYIWAKSSIHFLSCLICGYDTALMKYRCRGGISSTWWQTWVGKLRVIGRPPNRWVLLLPSSSRTKPWGVRACFWTEATCSKWLTDVTNWVCACVIIRTLRQ